MLTALPLLALAPALQGEPDEPPRVRLELLSTAAAVAPGEELELAARLVLPEGWHVYWENPGETGMATSARLEAPGGFGVEGPRFPAPERFEDPGGIVSYGYQGEAWLFFRVRAPRALEAGAVLRFEVGVDWLACKEACHLGSASARLELRAAAEPAPPRDLPGLERARARLPRPWSELEGARLSWTPTGERRGELRVRVEGARARAFFPLESAGAELEDSRGEGDGLALGFALEEGASPRLRGVLEVESDGATRWYALDHAPASPRQRAGALLPIPPASAAPPRRGP